MSDQQPQEGQGEPRHPAQPESTRRRFAAAPGGGFDQPARRRGRPIRGAIAGLLFGLFLSLDLVIFGVVALHADILAVLPLLGLAAGIVLGMTAPMHRRSTPSAAAPAPAPEGRPAEPPADRHPATLR